MRGGIYKSFRKAWDSNVEKYKQFIHRHDKNIKPGKEFSDEVIDKLISNNNKFVGYIPETSNIDDYVLILNATVKDVEKECYQAMEGFVHNLNTLHSRAGSQVPFSSINLGTDTTNAGRMVTKNLLLALEAGLGHGETCIFPIVIFKVKEGVNYNEGDPNYDLFKLSFRVTGKRLFPKHIGAA